MSDRARWGRETGTIRPALLPLKVRGLVFEAGGRRIIDHVDLDLAGGGGITVILGPNGAGKSMLLRLLHGLIAPSAGSIVWGGNVIDETVRRRQAMVFQKPVLLRRSVAANLRFAAGLRGVGERAARVAAMLELAGLADLAGHPARVLSGGEQQRLALARALLLEPEVLMLDEPTASLDPASVLAIEAIVTAARARGATILLVTHDIGQARRLADEVVFLHRGRVAEQASAATFFTASATPQARAYLEGRIVI